MTTPFVDIVEDDINKAKALLAEAEKLFDEDEFENYALVIEKSSQALNLWINHVGDRDVALAPLYAVYGKALFTEATVESDCFGDVAHNTIEEKGRQIKEQLDKEEAEELEKNNGTLDKVTEEAEQDEEKEAEEEKQPEDNVEDKAEADEKQADIEEDSESESEEEDNKGQEGANTDPLVLAWEVLDLARVMYEKDPSKGAALSEVHVTLGRIAMENEQNDEALAEFESAKGLAKASGDNRLLATVMYYFGLLHEHTKNPDLAVEALTAAKELLVALGGCEGIVADIDLKIEVIQTPEEKQEVPIPASSNSMDGGSFGDPFELGVTASPSEFTPSFGAPTGAFVWPPPKPSTGSGPVNVLTPRRVSPSTAPVKRKLEDITPSPMDGLEPEAKRTKLE